MKRSLTLTAVLVVVAACNRGISPSDSVDTLMAAVTAKDSLEIARLVDVTRVSQSAVDPLIEAAGQMAELDPDGFGQQAGGFGMQMLEQFRPMIAPFIEQLFWQMLLDPESMQQGPLGQVLRGREIRLDELAAAYQGVISESENGADSVLVTIELAPEDVAIETVTVDLQLERAQGYWRVVGFSDLAQTFGELMSAR